MILGSSNSLSAPSPQTVAGTTYTFSSWSDGGAQSHNVVANADATYTATFTGGGTPAVAPRNTALPTHRRQGAGRVAVLTATPGTWSGTQPITFAYQWLRCSSAASSSCTPVQGATAQSYTPVAADVGARLRVRVTAANSAGQASADSSATSPVKR